MKIQEKQKPRWRLRMMKLKWSSVTVLPTAQIQPQQWDQRYRSRPTRAFAIQKAVYGDVSYKTRLAPILPNMNCQRELQRNTGEDKTDWIVQLWESAECRSQAPRPHPYLCHLMQTTVVQTLTYSRVTLPSSIKDASWESWVRSRSTVLRNDSYRLNWTSSSLVATAPSSCL